MSVRGSDLIFLWQRTMGNSNVLYTAKVKKKKKWFYMFQNEENINEEIKPYLNIIQSPHARKHLMVPPEQKLCFLYINLKSKFNKKKAMPQVLSLGLPHAN